MLSCTEFIPYYSELFKFIDSKAGHDAVVRYWEYISDTTIEKALGELIDEKGVDGCWDYWARTLNEEAADFIRVYDVDKKEITSEMRDCPSKGLLLKLSYMEPYYDYCGHCGVLYSRVMEKRGIYSERDNSHVDEARCSSRLYQKLPEGAAPAASTGKKLVMDVHASDNKYLHRDFHLHADMGIRYVGTRYGTNGVHEFLRVFAQAYYKPLFADVDARGLTALQERLEKLYAAEELPETLHTELSDGELRVHIDKCPAVTFFKRIGYEPSKWYSCLTETVEETIADMCGLGFELLSYDSATGAAQYRYFRRSF